MAGTRKPPEQAALDATTAPETAAAEEPTETTGETAAAAEEPGDDVLDALRRVFDTKEMPEALAAIAERAYIAIDTLRSEVSDLNQEPWEGTEQQARARLFGKLAAVMGTVAAIPKSEYRTVEVTTRSGGSYTYDFIPEGVLMERIRPELAKRGVAVLYSDEIVRWPESEDDNAIAVTVRLTFADGETGATWTCKATAEGTDTGDKAASKAKTTAIRYLLWKMFLVSGDLDPETENVERRSGGGGRSGGRPATDKQKDFARRILTEADEAGIRDTDDRRPQDAVHVRRPVEDLDSPTCSWLIDETKNAKDAVGTADLARINEVWTQRLDERLGEPTTEPDFPPSDAAAADDGWVDAGAASSPAA